MLDFLGKLVINFFNFIKNLFPQKVIKIPTAYLEESPKPKVDVSFITANKALCQTEEANLQRVKDKLNGAMEKISKLISEQAQLGKKEAYLPIAFNNANDILVGECFKIIKNNGFTLLQNSMTGQWVIRW